MNDINSINTQQDAINGVRNSKFIVGSVDANGKVSFAENPALHDHATVARAECRRLAKLAPGKLFIFVPLFGGEMIPVNALSI